VIQKNGEVLIEKPFSSTSSSFSSFVQENKENIIKNTEDSISTINTIVSSPLFPSPKKEALFLEQTAEAENFGIPNAKSADYPNTSDGKLSIEMSPRDKAKRAEAMGYLTDVPNGENGTFTEPPKAEGNVNFKKTPLAELMEVFEETEDNDELHDLYRKVTEKWKTVWKNMSSSDPLRDELFEKCKGLRDICRKRGLVE
jgi:hypothetical protein